MRKIRRMIKFLPWCFKVFKTAWNKEKQRIKIREMEERFYHDARLD